MANQVYRICQHCGTENLNRDYCKNCNNIINISLERKLKRDKQALEKAQKAKMDKKNSFPSFIDRAKNHPNIIVRSLTKLIYSIWLLMIAIGSFIAFLLGYIAA